MIKLQVSIYGQRELKWHNEKLGTSNVEIGSYGCLLSCMAMICKYYGNNEDPLTLNKKLISVGGYTDGNLYEWYGGVPAIYHDIECTGLYPVPDPLSEGQRLVIEQELKAGRPVVCEVDFNPYTAVVDMHWILIVGIDDNGIFICNDPWDGREKLITDYGKQNITLQYFVTHKGVINMSDTNSDLDKIYKATGTKTADELIEVWKKEMGFLEQERKSNKELTVKYEAKVDEYTKLSQKYTALESMFEAEGKDYERQIETIRLELKGTKTEKEDILRELAGVLSTTQNFNQILAEVTNITNKIDSAVKEADSLRNEKVIWEKKRIELEGEIEKLKTQLNATDLTAYDLDQLMRAVIKKIVKIIKEK